jgi:hypothetical protein
MALLSDGTDLSTTNNVVSLQKTSIERDVPAGTPSICGSDLSDATTCHLVLASRFPRIRIVLSAEASSRQIRENPLPSSSIHGWPQGGPTTRISFPETSSIWLANDGSCAKGSREHVSVPSDVKSAVFRFTWGNRWLQEIIVLNDMEKESVSTGTHSRSRLSQWPVSSQTLSGSFCSNAETLLTSAASSFWPDGKSFSQLNVNSKVGRSLTPTRAHIVKCRKAGWTSGASGRNEDAFRRSPRQFVG